MSRRKMKKGRILSGMRPTGKLHLGNLEGALRQWVELQDDYECFFEIADWHALTTAWQDTSELSQFIRDLAIDWLSAGIDPNRSVIFVQSLVPEHAELHLLFSMFVPVPWLERNPTYKDWIDELGPSAATYGLLGYPVLQAADILIYKADTVPVGKDQLPHLELTREIARRFNHLYGNIFPEPQARITEFALVPGIDGRKMSKTYNNHILMSESREEVERKIKRMFTDPQKVHMGDPGHPEGCPVFSLHRIYNANETQDIEAECRSGKLGCVPCKERLARRVNEELEPYRERRAYYEAHIHELDELLREGSKKAREVAKRTLEEVRTAMKLWK